MGKLHQAFLKHLKAEKKGNKIKQNKDNTSISKVLPEKKSLNNVELVPVHIWSDFYQTRIMDDEELKKRTVKQAHLIPYSPSTSRILCLGEGDFGFSAALAQIFGSADHVLATSLDTHEQTLSKYPNTAAQNLDKLTHVLHGIDATKLDTNKNFLKMINSKISWPTRVVFNFPHTGSGIKDVDHNVRKNQKMLLGFFISVGKMFESMLDRIPKNILTVNTVMMTKHAFERKFKGNIDNAVSDGEDDQPLASEELVEIHVTLKSGEPYSSWNVQGLAKQANQSLTKLKFVLNRSFVFNASLYPGYNHQRTIGDLFGQEDCEDFVRNARTYVWVLQ